MKSAKQSFIMLIMEKKKLLFLVPIMSLMTLVGCNDNTTPKKININIGTKLETVNEIESDTELDLLLSSEEGEGIMLATYSKIRVDSCGCGSWTAFREDVLNRYVRHYNVPIYFFNTDYLTDQTASKYTIVKNSSSDPEFYIYQNTKLIKKYTFQDKVRNIYQWERFEAEMKERIVRPEKFQMFYVTEKYLFDDKNLQNADEAILLTERNACGDCSYLIPKYFVPYTESHTLKKEIWVFDIQKYNILGNTSEEYKGIINKCQLSAESNKTFGYGRGYVPTIQYYQKGELKDAAVTFNDSLTIVDDKYVVTDSYYTTKRAEDLPFLKNSNVETKVLVDQVIPEEDIQTFSISEAFYFMWSHDGAMKLHKPILDAFLTTYC